MIKTFKFSDDVYLVEALLRGFSSVFYILGYIND
jgi:hypothetical protein